MQRRPEPDHEQIAARRRRARRTALWMGGIAALVYIGFLLSGVFGQ